MSPLDRLFPRDSRRLAQSILIPLSLVFAVVTVYALLTVGKASERLSHDRLDTLTQALAVSADLDDSDARLRAIAEAGGLDRIWIVSATGRILSSSRNGERESFVEDRWWTDLSPNSAIVHRVVEWGGRDYFQIAYQDVAEGRWAIIVAERSSGAWTNGFTMVSVLLLALIIWLASAAIVSLVISRRHGSGMKALGEITRSVLDGDAVAQPHVERVIASLGSDSPLRYLGLVVHRLQERAVRANEAESRFALALDLLPGMAYVASFDGSLLVAGAGLRAQLGDQLIGALGRSVTSLDAFGPFSRVHGVITHARAHGVTFDNLPIDTTQGGSVQVSARAVRLRDVEGYLAVVREPETETAPSTVDPDLVLAAALHTESDLVMVFDDQARTIVWNEAAIKSTGYLPEDVPTISSVIEELFPDLEERARFIAWLDGGLRHESIQTRIERADGEHRTLLWEARELSRGGRMLGGLLRARETTEGTDPSEDLQIPGDSDEVVEQDDAAEPEAEIETDASTEPEAEMETDASTEPEAEIETDASTEPEAEIETDPKLEPQEIDSAAAPTEIEDVSAPADSTEQVQDADTGTADESEVGDDSSGAADSPADAEPQPEQGAVADESSELKPSKGSRVRKGRSSKRRRKRPASETRA